MASEAEERWKRLAALTAQGIPVAPAFVSAVKGVLESPRQRSPNRRCRPRTCHSEKGSCFTSYTQRLCSYSIDEAFGIAESTGAAKLKKSGRCSGFVSSIPSGHCPARWTTIP